MRVWVLNGPNLGRLGRRQPEIYGTTTHDELAELCSGWGRELGLEVETRQTNHEGVLVDCLNQAADEEIAIVLNAGALTHTSIALHDALYAFDGPVIEVHISQVHKREAFRHRSYVSLRADAVIVGAGTEGYLLALRRVATLVGSGARGRI